MKPIKAISFALTLVAVIMMATASFAHDYTVGPITVDHPWARASAGAAKSGGAFMMIKNDGTTADRLIAVDSPVAKMSHLHTTIMENDVMKMRPVDGVGIPAGGMAELKPGSFHIMFMGLKAPLEEGQMVPLTLTFEQAGTLEIEAYVTEAGAMESMDGMNMGN